MRETSSHFQKNFEPNDYLLMIIVKNASWNWCFSQQTVILCPRGCLGVSWSLLEPPGAFLESPGAMGRPLGRPCRPPYLAYHPAGWTRTKIFQDKRVCIPHTWWNTSIINELEKWKTHHDSFFSNVSPRKSIFFTKPWYDPMVNTVILPEAVRQTHTRKWDFQKQA